jgi:hypothetical protein
MLYKNALPKEKKDVIYYLQYYGMAGAVSYYAPKISITPCCFSDTRVFYLGPALYKNIMTNMILGSQ